MIPPSEWLPRIFGEAEAGEATLDHAMLDQIMALYHTITDTVLDPPAGLPTDCPAAGGRARPTSRTLPRSPSGHGAFAGDTGGSTPSGRRRSRRP